MLINFAQQADKLVFVRTSAAQYLPPGGRGTAKRWMRNGDISSFGMHLNQTIQIFQLYLLTELQTDLEHIAVPHPPQCAHWGTFPPGEGIARPSSLQIPIYRAAEKTDIHAIILHIPLRRAAVMTPVLRRRIAVKVPVFFFLPALIFLRPVFFQNGMAMALDVIVLQLGSCFL